jgi:hypothetical protein
VRHRGNVAGQAEMLGSKMFEIQPELFNSEPYVRRPTDDAFHPIWDVNVAGSNSVTPTSKITNILWVPPLTFAIAVLALLSFRAHADDPDVDGCDSHNIGGLSGDFGRRAIAALRGPG